ncbi:MAG: molybdopterin-dependent oxidoreductase [Planctomycetaceae bacterium]|nr:molybdopterin-dependent oxidoreductase [Planctomycetaceae bacterium]
MNALDQSLSEHQHLTRRFFLSLSTVGAATLAVGSQTARANELAPELAEAIGKLESFMTPLDKFRDVSRGKPLPHSLPPEKKAEVGLTRETWKLEVTSDTDKSATRLKKPMTKADGTALDFNGLMQIAETHSVRFAKVMTCLNIGCPLGTGIWEGVPLREIIWRTQPVENLRRVFYYGYHNDDPGQMFRSSLPIGRVLEDPYDLPPVILCYKLNGQFLSPERGGPVRVVVPEAYGFKSIKWLSHIVLTNLAYANDTYIDGNNDVDSPLKTWAATLSVPKEVAANQPIPVTGYAQVGISGLSKVQVWICPKGTEPENDPNFTTAKWSDAKILSPPKAWGGDLPDGKIPADTQGFDANGQPKTWPMRLSKVHWAALLPGLAAGDYTLRSRTVDEKGIAQPLPRPFRKSGHAAIEQVSLVVK